MDIEYHTYGIFEGISHPKEVEAILPSTFTATVGL